MVVLVVSVVGYIHFSLCLEIRKALPGCLFYPWQGFSLVTIISLANGCRQIVFG